MRTDLPLLNQIHVASPCPADWDAMVGDDRSRFCGECNKHVYNLSAMTRLEAETLLIEKEGQLCARFYRRSDGTVLTTDCPVGVHHRIQRRRRGSAMLASFVTILGLSGCTDPGRPDHDDLPIFAEILQGLRKEKQCLTGEPIFQAKPGENIQGGIGAPQPVAGEVDPTFFKR